LSDGRLPGCELPPVISTHEEAAFDLETHCPSSHYVQLGRAGFTVTVL
jgi:hypothetical protein